MFPSIVHEANMSGSSPLYAAIDLGSNSFHMLVVRNIEGAVRAVSRVKRKVRLASGLDNNNYLSEDSINRGLDCLRLFAEQLKDIPPDNVRIVGTATLRIAKNSQDFVTRAERILRHSIEIISGENEARTIYYGVINTTSCCGNNLVIDIGGASTELIIGFENNIKVLHSTPMGCVTWLNKFFSDNIINESNYMHAIAAAKDIFTPYISEYKSVGFVNCMGASGTVQALQEIMIANGESEVITLNKLYKLKLDTILCGTISALHIEGVTSERLNVFPSGLAILIAIFEELSVQAMTLACGALREGVIYSMLGENSCKKDTRVRTVDSLIVRYQLDREQALRVSTVSLSAFDSLKYVWNLDEVYCRSMIKWAAMLHEIGLCIEYKNAPQHASYIIDNIDLPGFSLVQKHLLSALLLNQRGCYQLSALNKQNVVSYDQACALIRILRIAIIICIRRSDDALIGDVIFEGNSQGDLIISIPLGWLDTNYLRATALNDEIEMQIKLGWKMEIRER